MTFHHLGKEGAKIKPVKIIVFYQTPLPPPLPDSFLKTILGHFGPFLDPNIAIWFLITHLPPPSLKQLKSSSALVEHYQLW